MNFPRHTCVNVACLIVLVAVGSFPTVTAKRYCGEQLTRALSMLCVEYYTLDDLRRNTVSLYPQMSTSQFASLPDWSGENFNENEFKRNFNVVPEDNNALGGVDDELTGQWFKTKPYHRFIVPHIATRVRRNVANECCREECTMNQLMSYCKVVAPGIPTD
ncbi:LIRP-like [Anopheles maculipalpis]|uniref:LIRP-like n=1 Tax=Anopheles maculipalpis TaxID=1496333 RepID=UPI0021596B25|nr:LIRP-like [Anopheles maculipalpis]